jgi:threonylcarbamoyladenosine tRNA methylthiotransferase MtaB
MRTFSIYTLGCKVNHYESAQIRQFFEENGLKSAKNGEKPDFCVINTCCVTATASAKSRQYIQRATRTNPNAVKIVCGCLATLQSPPGSQVSQKGQSDELRMPKDNATHIISNRTELASKIKEITGGTSAARHAAHSENLPLLRNFKEQTRAFLKIQDGCDGKCSYCIIPKVRPDVQSKPLQDVIFEAKNLVAAGHKEIVITGVNLGAYGRDSTRKSYENPENCHFERAQRFEKSDFLNLLKELALIDGLYRIRISSLEPGDISSELLDVFCAHKNIMPHIHLSVQSGSDAILRRMCRPYSAAELREKISLIKRSLDRPAITCDLIVGFPGETDEDFEQTCELAKWAGFSKIHVFPSSPRAGTAAYKMKNKVDSKIIKKRAEILRRLGDKLGVKFREQFIGETCEVLIENTNLFSGHSERYFMIYIELNEQRLEKNQIVNAKITKNIEDGVVGQIDVTR